jgi:hypothetical protein
MHSVMLQCYRHTPEGSRTVSFLYTSKFIQYIWENAPKKFCFVIQDYEATDLRIQERKVFCTTAAAAASTTNTTTP